ncbi:putative Telomerase reverse transcriptase [Leptomonas pyrrhocoris]|uniref:Telomerase reverse transcriptase n=1 Tax=Leptomonas pyrrhocoris TaxID=157538 RepID=A0A0N0DW83_LEPPY|nr:putative Telomerase reverse transcriptase [Leptomonas pyrrhocoris]KPA81418.1 putative Telomerase reverse transcriptase [Leptomonas pyrrhocoris]|eukprot:XP_015659857.1 putative Telomerase reverse transcriptase [Leptomonas pyrrhocoris]
MSSSFPSVPGFIGPLSLRTFLENYFALKLTFGTNAEPSRVTRAGHAPSRTTQDVVLSVNEAFLVVVYVARHAPAAPRVPAARAAQHSNDSSVAPSVNSKARGQAVAASLKANHRPSSTSTAASWLLYTQADHRPLTRALLQHPWWLSLASLLGPAAVAFVELYCPMVLQLEAMAGGLQVLGPALLQNAAAPAAHHNAVHRWREVKRAREEATAVPVRDNCSPLSKKSRPEGTADSVTAAPVRLQENQSTANKSLRNGRKELRKSHAKSVSTFLSKRASTWEAALPRTDVSRTRLYSVQDKVAMNARWFTQNTKEGVAEDSEPMPMSLLEALWVGRHPRSLQCAVRAALPRWQALRLERLSSSPQASVLPFSQDTKNGDAEAAPLCLPLCFVRHAFRWMELKSLSPANAESRPAMVAGKTSFSVSAHLQHVLSSALDQCSRLDLRGAALKHLHYIEVRFQRQQQAQEPSDIQRLAAPVDVVVAYLRTLLSALRWSFAADSCGADSPACSFWGVEEANGARVLDALLTTVRAWLLAGRHAVFPVSRFLDGVPVAQLPWLRGFFTCPLSQSPSSARHARRQRSQIQQRVWLQFVLFLTQDVLPFLVRSSFAVTWSSKNTNQLIFYPASVWRRVVRCELNRTVSSQASGSPLGDVTATKTDNNTCPPPPPTNVEDGKETEHTHGAKRLSPLSFEQIEQRKGAATLTARNGRPSLLYAAVRFRPDGRKLRPIAVLRSASCRSISAMARGAPGPYHHRAALVRLLTRIVARLGVAVPPSTTNVLAWVQRMSDKGDSFVVPRPPLHHLSPLPLPRDHQPPHKNALQGVFRCLLSGAEERRVQSGLPKLSNLSHQDEYAELRSFCEEARCRAGATNEEEKESVEEGNSRHGSTFSKTAPHIFLVRSDALRCYDNLPQTRVLAEAHALVSHDAYRTLSFTAIFHSAECSCEDTSSLHRTLVSRTVPWTDVANGKLARIPRGHVYWEEESKDGKQGGGAKGTTSGTAVRALLHEHLQHHLIVLNGRLFVQHVGILQGSPVAMLLCDQLFAKAVDTSLSSILSEHAERSLLLRRVDDVLVATTSPVAGQRCLQAMQRGWPSVGYRSNAKKLTMSAGDGKSVPWCGLLLHDTTLETSVEWRRMGPVLSSVRVADTIRAHCGDREPLLFTQRLLAAIYLRVPPTALCGRINSKLRQLQTFYEAALLWSRLIVWKVQETLATAHHRCVAVLLLRPLAACIARLCRLLRRHHEFLAARQSGCDVRNGEVRACVLTALHRTLQVQLRVLVRKRMRHARERLQQPQRGHCPSGRGRQRRANDRKMRVATAHPQDVIRRRVHTDSATSQSTFRAFWWCAALQIEAQWCGSLAALEREGENARAAEEDAELKQRTPAATAHLLRDVGPSSLHMEALRATQLLFKPDTDSAICSKAGGS